MTPPPLPALATTDMSDDGCPRARFPRSEFRVPPGGALSTAVTAPLGATRVSIYVPEAVALPAGVTLAWAENATGIGSLPFVSAFNGPIIRMGIPNTREACLIVTNLDAGLPAIGWLAWE